MRTIYALSFAVLTTISIAQGNDAPASEPKLFDKLGGKAGITKVVDMFVGNVAGDARINKFFAATAGNPTRLAAFKGKLVDQICEATGGDCKYTGKSMKDAHRGMGVSNADFTALVEDLTKALTDAGVGKGEQGQILAVLGPMGKDIVEKKDAIAKKTGKKH